MCKGSWSLYLAKRRCLFRCQKCFHCFGLWEQVSSSFFRKLPCESGPTRGMQQPHCSLRPLPLPGPGAAGDAPLPPPTVLVAWGAVGMESGLHGSITPASVRLQFPSSFPPNCPSWAKTPPLGTGLFCPFCPEKSHLKSTCIEPGACVWLECEVSALL